MVTEVQLQQFKIFKNITDYHTGVYNYLTLFYH